MAPDNLNQPILSGSLFAHTINITERNSSFPELERDIVEKISYGKQLGVLTDALVELLDNRSDRSKNKLIEQYNTIKEIKSLKKSERISRIKTELENIKVLSSEDYDALINDICDGKKTQ